MLWNYAAGTSFKYLISICKLFGLLGDCRFEVTLYILTRRKRFIENLNHECLLWFVLVLSLQVTDAVVHNRFFQSRAALHLHVVVKAGLRVHAAKLRIGVWIDQPIFYGRLGRIFVGKLVWATPSRPHLLLATARFKGVHMKINLKASSLDSMR